MKLREKIIIGILIILFCGLIVLIKMDKIAGFDTTIYNLVTFKMTDNMNTIYKVLTFFGSTLFIILLSVFFFFLFLIMKKKNCSFIVAGVIIISTIVNNVVKIIIRRARPTVLALVTEKSFSFPSGHTMASVSLYGILLYLVLKSKLDKKLKVVFSTFLVLLPILVGISRIYLGAHFASDVIGAGIMSIILLLIETNVIAKNKWL